MITSLHPKYFIDRDNKQVYDEPLPKDEIIFVQLKDICSKPSDVIQIIEQIFDDIKAKKQLRNFQVKTTQKAGVSGAIVDSLILEPNIGGVGVDLKKIFSVFKRKKS